MIWEIFLIDEKELEPAKDSIILWSCRAPFGVFIIQVMIENRRGDLLLVSLGEPWLFPVGGELDFVVFADSTPRDARVSVWKTLESVDQEGMVAYVVPKSMPSTKTGLACSAAMLNRCEAIYST